MIANGTSPQKNKKVGENNRQLRFVRHHVWRAQARKQNWTKKKEEKNGQVRFRQPPRVVHASRLDQKNSGLVCKKVAESQSTCFISFHYCSVSHVNFHPLVLFLVHNCIVSMLNAHCSKASWWSDLTLSGYYGFRSHFH